jgi:hypothetical protein
VKVLLVSVVFFVIGAAALLGVEVGWQTVAGSAKAATAPAKLPYVASPERTQLYKSGAKGDAVLYRVVDMPREGLRCVFLVSTARYGRAASCQPLNALQGR